MPILKTNQMKQMKHTHTPGPWVTSFSDVVRDSKGRKIADCELTPFDERPEPANREDIANALLIAAAPDMLEALEFLMEQYDSSGDFTMGGDLTNKPFLMARAAIAKAMERGEA